MEKGNSKVNLSRQANSTVTTIGDEDAVGKSCWTRLCAWRLPVCPAQCPLQKGR